MKTNYGTPEICIRLFAEEDVIKTSGIFQTTGAENDFPDPFTGIGGSDSQ